MANKWLTVRAGYLYFFIGSMLLSSIFLFIVHKAFRILYSHYASDRGAFVVRLSHWLINHVGKTPIFVFLFLAVFISIFMLRSQKTADDVKALLKAAEDLACRGSFKELEVSSVGELRVLAGHLRSLNESAAFFRQERVLTQNNEQEYTAQKLENEDVMALILRLKSLLRLIEEAENGEGKPEHTERVNVKALKQEALGMERLLESLMVVS